MKKIVLTIVLACALSSGLHAEINNRPFLETMFNGCNSPGPDYDDLVQIIGVGGIFEYCGCTVNEMSKHMDLKDLVQLGVDALSLGSSTEEEISNEQLSIMLKNEQFSNAVVKCLTNVIR